MSYQKINTYALGVALGLTWGLGMFLLGMIGWIFGFGINLIHIINNIYIGFKPTLVGSIVGLLFGFVDAFIGGIIIGVIYNSINNRCIKLNKK